MVGHKGHEDTSKLIYCLGQRSNKTSTRKIRFWSRTIESTKESESIGRTKIRVGYTCTSNPNKRWRLLRKRQSRNICCSRASKTSKQKVSFACLFWNDFESTWFSTNLLTVCQQVYRIWVWFCQIICYQGLQSRGFYLNSLALRYYAVLVLRGVYQILSFYVFYGWVQRGGFVELACIPVRHSHLFAHYFRLWGSILWLRNYFWRAT